MLDIITAALILFFCCRGTKKGFVKSALGIVSVIVCGFITVFAYNYLSDVGFMATVEHEIFSRLSPEVSGVLEYSGIADYITSGILAIIIFIAVRILYGLAAEILDFAVPGFLNSALGGALGLVQGLAIVLFVLGIVYLASGSVPEAVQKIDGTSLVSALYYNNPVLTVLGIKNI